MSTIVCRCENVSEATILQALRHGTAVSANEIKLITRAGKGLCQGRCCFDLVAHLVSRTTGRACSELPPPSVRPPVRPIPMGVLGTVDDPGISVDANVLSLQTNDAGRSAREQGEAHGR